jgi:hypothetical protein
MRMMPSVKQETFVLEHLGAKVAANKLPYTSLATALHIFNLQKVHLDLKATTISHALSLANRSVSSGRCVHYPL